MDSVLIEKLLQNDEIVSKISLGVYARDELPPNPPYPSCFIFNTEPRGSGGEHWLAIYISQAGRAELFDSFAHDPEYFNLERYMHDISNHGWTFNRKKIQGKSDLCGLYCVLYLLFAARGQTRQFYSQFNSNYRKNDSLLFKFLNMN